MFLLLQIQLSRSSSAENSYYYEKPAGGHIFQHGYWVDTQDLTKKKIQSPYGNFKISTQYLLVKSTLMLFIASEA